MVNYKCLKYITQRICDTYQEIFVSSISSLFTIWGLGFKVYGNCLLLVCVTEISTLQEIIFSSPQ